MHIAILERHIWKNKYTERYTPFSEKIKKTTPILMMSHMKFDMTLLENLLTPYSPKISIHNFAKSSTIKKVKVDRKFVSIHIYLDNYTAYTDIL